MNEEIFEGLSCSTLTDCTDEFIKTRELLEQGDLVFIYKNTEMKGVENNVLEVCIRRNNPYTCMDQSMEKLDKYIVELYTTSYSVIYPHVPRTYLEVELYEILKDSKVPSDVLVTYKQIIEDLR